MPNVAELIRKQFVAKTEVDTEERTVTAVISTSAVDRDREVVLAKGAILDNFIKNPVVLFAHDFRDMPIGKALWIKKGRDKITAKIQFATVDQNPVAEQVYQLFKGGFLNAFSIGFDVKKSHVPTPEEIKKKPELAEAIRIYDEWELLEFSVVPVPANPEALSTAVKTKEITLSDDIIKDLELEIEEDEIFIASEPEVREKKEPEPITVAIEVKAIEPIKVKEMIEVSTFIDVKAIANEEIKRRKGIIYD